MSRGGTRKSTHVRYEWPPGNEREPIRSDSALRRFDPLVVPKSGGVFRCVGGAVQTGVASVLTLRAAAEIYAFTDDLRGGPRWYRHEVTAMLPYPTLEKIRDLGLPLLIIRGNTIPAPASRAAAYSSRPPGAAAR